MRISLFHIAALIIVLSSCKDKINEPLPQNESFVLEAPGNLGKIPNIEVNKPARDKIEIGRMLFYDPILSGNNRISCATCHDQRKAFTDGLALSDRGISGRKLLRHAPPLFNLVWVDGLFWDGGSLNLESLSIGPLTHPDEMNQDIAELVDEIKSNPRYNEAIQMAYSTDQVELKHILYSLAQFQRFLISGNSRYDKYIRSEDAVMLSDSELKGLSLYKEHCQSCHSTDLFTDNAYHNNGIDSSWNDISHEYIFTGRFRISDDSADLGKFKTPSLRNVEFTAPYMHDGRFETLEDVLDHYSTGVKKSPSLDKALIRNNGELGISLSPEDKKHLISFMKSLSDYEFIENPNFAPPRR